MKTGKTVCLSVVSHNQDELVEKLLESVAAFCDHQQIYVIVTRNTKTKSRYCFDHFPFPVTIIQNKVPKGFGANHNQAFTRCTQDYFGVINPDIIVISDLFNDLVSFLSARDTGVAAPLLIDQNEIMQDNARRFPSPLRIISRICFRRRNQYDYPETTGIVYPDWVAGMAMLFPATVYREVGGFDDKYFMYCEDADICMRLRLHGYRVKLITHVRAVHNPARASHRSLRHLAWHISSLFRFFRKYPLLP